MFSIFAKLVINLPCQLSSRWLINCTLSLAEYLNIIGVIGLFFCRIFLRQNFPKCSQKMSFFLNGQSCSQIFSCSHKNGRNILYLIFLLSKKLIALFLPCRYQNNRIAKVFDIYCENSSYFFFSKVIFSRKEMVIFLLMLAKICLLNKFSSQLVCRKRFFVAWKCSHETIVWVWDPKKNIWFRSNFKIIWELPTFWKSYTFGSFPVSITTTFSYFKNHQRRPSAGKNQRPKICFISSSSLSSSS